MKFADCHEYRNNIGRKNDKLDQEDKDLTSCLS